MVSNVGRTSDKNPNACVDTAAYHGGSFVSHVGWTSDKNQTVRADTVAYHDGDFVGEVGWSSDKNPNACVDTVVYHGNDCVNDVGWTSDKNLNVRYRKLNARPTDVWKHPPTDNGRWVGTSKTRPRGDCRCGGLRRLRTSRSKDSCAPSPRSRKIETDQAAYHDGGCVSEVGRTSYKNLNARADRVAYRGSGFASEIGQTSDKNQTA